MDLRRTSHCNTNQKSSFATVAQYVSSRGEEIWVKVEIEMDGPDLTELNMEILTPGSPR